MHLQNENMFSGATLNLQMLCCQPALAKGAVTTRCFPFLFEYWHILIVNSTS